MDISGKVALITGSAKRIGRETALELARRGATIAIHYRSSREEALETAQAVKQAGAEAEVFEAELTDHAAVQRMIRGVAERFGRLDILVNNASIFRPSTADDATTQEWDDEMEANAKAPFFVAQEAARLILPRGHGKIINIVDVAGEVIWRGYFAYSISKAALIAVNRGLAKAYAPTIQVNGIAPGPILFPDYYTEEQKRTAIDQTLLRRAGSPKDIVNAIVFLIENDYITGEVLHVDGGRHAM